MSRKAQGLDSVLKLKIAISVHATHAYAHAMFIHPAKERLVTLTHVHVILF